MMLAMPKTCIVLRCVVAPEQMTAVWIAGEIANKNRGRMWNGGLLYSTPTGSERNRVLDWHLTPKAKKATS
jgi:hypothetical protein